MRIAIPINDTRFKVGKIVWFSGFQFTSKVLRVGRDFILVRSTGALP